MKKNVWSRIAEEAKGLLRKQITRVTMGKRKENNNLKKK